MWHKRGSVARSWSWKPKTVPHHFFCRCCCCFTPVFKRIACDIKWIGSSTTMCGCSLDREKKKKELNFFFLLFFFLVSFLICSFWSLFCLLLFFVLFFNCQSLLFSFQFVSFNVLIVILYIYTKPNDSCNLMFFFLSYCSFFFLFLFFIISFSFI